MPNKDGTANALDGLKAIGIGAAFALLIVWAGSSIHNSWTLFLVTPACTALGGSLASKAYGKKTKLITTLYWAALGLVVAFIWYMFL